MRKVNVQFVFVSWEQPNSLCCMWPTLSSKRIFASELEARRKFCILQVLLVSLKHQQDKEIPAPASLLSTEVWIYVFPSFSTLPSTLLSLGFATAKPQNVQREQRTELWTITAPYWGSWSVTWPSWAVPSLTTLCSSGRTTKHILSHPTLLWSTLILDVYRWDAPHGLVL